MDSNNRYKFIDNDEQHLHTLDLAPLIGTTSVLSVVAKPLTWWAAGKACEELGWVNDRVKGVIVYSLEERIEKVTPVLEEIKQYTPEEYLKRLDKAYKAHSKSLGKSAKKGKDLHKELERFVKNQMITQDNAIDKTEYEPVIQPFIDWSKENVERFLWSEGYSYSDKYWIGGGSDAGLLLKNGEYAVVDFKSSREAYDNQFWQIGGYDIQISENGVFDRNGNQIYLLGENKITQHIVVPFGTEPVVPVVSREVDSNKEAFLAALILYKKINKIQ